MSITVQIKQDLENGETYLDLQDFKDLFDLTQIEYYVLDTSNADELKLSFFDKDKNPVKPLNKTL